MCLLACSVFVLLLVQISVSDHHHGPEEAANRLDAPVKPSLSCPPRGCKGAKFDQWISFLPWFPQCTTNIHGCRPKKCGKQCEMKCHPRKVWKPITCCRRFWVLKTKKCKCRWSPFKVPAKPEEVSNGTPLYKCEGALVPHWIPVSPIFPKCKYNQGRCRRQKCGRKTKPNPCLKTCFPKMVWKKEKCCHTFWVLNTEKCDCNLRPFPIPDWPGNNVVDTRDDA